MIRIYYPESAFRYLPYLAISFLLGAVANLVTYRPEALTVKKSVALSADFPKELQKVVMALREEKNSTEKFTRFYSIVKSLQCEKNHNCSSD